MDAKQIGAGMTVVEIAVRRRGDQQYIHLDIGGAAVDMDIEAARALGRTLLKAAVVAATGEADPAAFPRAKAEGH